MASLVAAERNNHVGIAAPGSDGARVMIVAVVGWTAAATKVDPRRLVRALEYATRMGARILSFSAHWSVTLQSWTPRSVRSPTGRVTRGGDRGGQRPQQGRAGGRLSRRLRLSSHRPGHPYRQRRRDLSRHQPRAAWTQSRRSERVRHRRRRAARDNTGSSRAARTPRLFWPVYSPASGRARAMLN